MPASTEAELAARWIPARLRLPDRGSSRRSDRPATPRGARCSCLASAQMTRPVA
jgi:hypothetical protein